MTLKELEYILNNPKHSLWHSETEGERIYIFRDFGGDENKITGILEVLEKPDFNYHIEIFISHNSFKCLNFNNPHNTTELCDFVLSEDRNQIKIYLAETPVLLFDLRKYK